MEHRERTWQQALQAHGLRLTPQREAILAYLAHTRAHPTVEEVFAAVREVFPHVARATVYNTLNRMVALGLLVELKRSDGAVRYETDDSPHANAICLRCGQVWDVPLVVAPEVDLSGFPGFEIRATHVELYGYCARCRQAMQREKEDRVSA